MLALQMDWEDPTEGSDLISDDDPTPPNSDDGDSEMVLAPATKPLVSAVLVHSLTLSLIPVPAQDLPLTLTQTHSDGRTHMVCHDLLSVLHPDPGSATGARLPT